jgi:predicted dehydrogenase
MLRQKLHAPYGEPAFRAALEAFAGAVEYHQPQSPDIDDGLRALQVVLAAVESADTGSTIRMADYLQRLSN